VREGGTRRRAHLAALAVVLAASAAYVGFRLDRGWVPHDEGMIGVNAERVLRGELPHRDFDESYTGGLTALHAAAFRVLGTRLTSPRLVLFAVFLAFTAAVYAIAARTLAPAGAALAALVAVGWSFPNYLASMPSWYVLTLAVLAVLALLRERDTGRRGWLFAAGLCAGASLLVLVVGLYVVAAALLYLAFAECESAARRPRGPGRIAFFLLQSGCVAGFLAVLLALVRRSLTPMAFLELVVPVAAVSAALLVRGWRVRGRGSLGERVLALARLVLPFLAGVALPAAALCAVYASQGALADLYRGVFVLPMRQISTATAPFPPLASAAAATPYAALLWVSMRRGSALGLTGLAAVAAVLAAILLLSSSEEVYRAIFHSARSLVVVAAAVGAAALVADGWRTPPAGDGEAFLLLASAALLALLQFPFAAPIYFCYAAPLAVLALAAIVPPRARPTHAAFAAFYLAFAVWRLNPGYIWTLGVRPDVYGPLAPLENPLAGLRVPESDAKTYAAIVNLVRRRTPESGYIYAAPDCPEVYFLSARRNPTRDVFEYLRPPPAPEALLGRLRETMVSIVVINERPDYSPALDAGTRAALASEFPHEENVGRFQVRWKERP
jgi:hypothetical protein